jgi:hypothetical protein
MLAGNIIDILCPQARGELNKKTFEVSKTSKV